MTELTIKQLKEQLTSKGIAFKPKDSKETLLKLIQETEEMTEENTQVSPFEAIVAQVITDLGKFDSLEVVQECLKVENDMELFSFVAENGERIAIEVGVLENAEQKKERIASEKKAKDEMKAKIADEIEAIEELPLESEGYTELLHKIVESTGATNALVRVSLKALYETQGAEMPKAKRVSKGGGNRNSNEFGGKYKAMADYIIANPQATREEIETFYEGTVRTSKAGPGGYVNLAVQLRTFAEAWIAAGNAS